MDIQLRTSAKTRFNELFVAIQRRAVAYATTALFICGHITISHRRPKDKGQRVRIRQLTAVEQLNIIVSNGRGPNSCIATPHITITNMPSEMKEPSKVLAMAHDDDSFIGRFPQPLFKIMQTLRCSPTHFLHNRYFAKT